MANNNCGQVSMPILDESQAKCTTFNYSTCIEVDERCNKIGNLPGDSLNDFIRKLCEKIAKMDNEIFRISKENEILKNRVSELEPKDIL